jgi:hypothetical protein
MTAIPIPVKKSSEKRSLLLVSGILAVIGLLLFVYLMWYVSPVEVVERVQVIAVTAEGCIAETIDEFAVNIGRCNTAPGEYILSPVDQSVKQRAAVMNPTN